MKQVFQKSYLSGELCVEEVPSPALQGAGVLVQNAASLISPGTERAAVSFGRKNLIEKARSQPERLKLLMRKMRQVGPVETFRLAMRKLDAPVPLGYSSAGTVTEVAAGLEGFYANDRVACAGAQFANHAEVVYVPKNLCVPLPDSLSFEEGAFVAPGAIALHGVRLSEIGLGDVVLVIGLGLIGQLTLQLVKAQGGIPIGVDLSKRRLEVARELGCAHAYTRNDPGLEKLVHQLTGGHGADCALVTAATRSDDPVIFAGEMLRERAKVVIVGDVGLNIPRTLYYKKELSVIVSRSYGPGRYDPDFEENGRDYPRGHIRWTERENMAAFLDLAARRQVRLQPLIERRFDVSDAHRAYEMLVDPNLAEEQPLGIVITYPQSIGEPHARTLNLQLQAAEPVSGKLGIGVVGAGNFMRSVLLPHIQSQPAIRPVGLVTRSGLSARGTADQFGFAWCGTDTRPLLEDKHVDAVFIGTRHDSHARLFCEAMHHHKHVFVEKPLATTVDELDRCVQAMRQHPRQRVMVGFNRRFAPFTRMLKDRLDQSTASRPLAISYRVNAGSMPADHWVHQAGGRIVGEVCHFIDYCILLAGGLPETVFAQSTGPADNPNRDILIQLTFSNGSTAQIQYLARSDNGLGKERIEVFSPVLTAEIDDFKTLRYRYAGKTRTEKSGKPDKGHGQEVQAFLSAIREGGENPIPVEELVAVTQATFAAQESLRTSAPVRLWPAKA